MLEFLLTPLLLKTARPYFTHSRKMLLEADVGLSFFTSALFINLG